MMAEITTGGAGYAAALATAVCWTLSAAAFTRAGERIGSLPVNVIRLLLAFPLLGLAWLASSGVESVSGWPKDAWVWLGISGLLGFFLSDLCMFRAFLEMGTRRSLLISSLAPPVVGLVGVCWMHEHLSGRQWAGMAVALAGVMWGMGGAKSAGSPDHSKSSPPGRSFRRGFLLAIVGMLAQAFSTVAAKQGLNAGGPSALGATLIRVAAGLAAFIVFVLLARQAGRVAAAVRDRRAMGILSAGVVAGPVLGVSLMMYSLQRIPAGVTQTFVALTPVLIIPFSAVMQREQITPRHIFGAVCAFAGVAML